MPQWIALSPSQHAGLGYLPKDGYHFADQLNVAGILLAELPKLLPHYVVVLLKEGEHFQPMVLLGVGERNLYVAPNGKWLGTYVPASLRGYPFTLANSEQPGEKVFAIDADHLSENQGDALFDDEGKLAGTAAQTLDFLTQCDRNRAATQQACDALQRAGVIEQWPLTIERGEGQEPLTVNGLYRINEAALINLEADVFATLKGAPMALAYAQMFSMGQLNQLADRAKFHAEHGATQEVPENLDSVLDGMDDDDLMFDFD
ncbi:SapC protein [Halomonas alkaliantarctica]|nr:SapC protein [Halomonas alkaliantarctica]